jgi:hypothetical protein
MTAPKGTLTRPLGGKPFLWNDDLLAELERCALADMPLTELQTRFAMEHRTLLRGALLRIRQLRGADAYGGAE